ncbi:MAG TPA: hypothetical protein VKR53_11190 [Puia sp.]|nr:hypothetical protein [Puia sp.]
MEMKIYTAKDLRERIYFLEQKKRQQEQALHDQLEDTYESLKSVNLIKSAFHNVLSEQNSLLPSIAGTLGSVIVKKILPGSSANIIKRFLGAAARWTISHLILNKSRKRVEKN